MKFFIANWKANKNSNEANVWIERFLSLPSLYDRTKIVICPPFPLLYLLKEKIKNTGYIYLGSQDLSAYEMGSYTGEVTAKSLSGLVDYAIIGHSERRNFFKENEDILFQKARYAKKYGIEPIFCIRDEKDQIPEEVKIIAYEPIGSIGTGKNEDPENVIKVKKSLSVSSNSLFLYGGSVEKENAHVYLQSSELDGILIGGASLDPVIFYQIASLA